MLEASRFHKKRSRSRRVARAPAREGRAGLSKVLLTLNTSTAGPERPQSPRHCPACPFKREGEGSDGLRSLWLDRADRLTPVPRLHDLRRSRLARVGAR